MNKCKYTKTDFKCDELALDSQEFCALHIPFSGIAKDDAKLNELKNVAISQKIGNNDYAFIGVILENLDLSSWGLGGELTGSEIKNDIYIENAQITDRFVLSGTTVIGLILVKNSHLGSLHCDDCNIKSNLEFEKSTMCFSKFYKTKIEGSFQLDECTASDTIVLSNSKIKENVTVKNSNIKGISLDDAEICSGIYLEHTDICGDISLRRCKTTNIYMMNLSIAGNIFLNDAKIHSGINFSSIQVSEKFSCYGIKFLSSNNKKIFKNQVEIFQKAAMICSRNNYRNDADKHYFHEMQARRKLKNIFYQFPDYIIEKLCKYGTDWRPIFIWWFAIIFLFAITYFCTGGLNYAGTKQTVTYFWDTVYFSIITITTLGYGDIYPTGITKIFAGSEAIIGTFFWALFIMVVGRKYMR